jgi:glycosyltransferase involved in cell wall biosynthesis
MKQSLSIVFGVMDENKSLIKTLDIIQSLVDWPYEVLIITSPKTLKSTHRVLEVIAVQNRNIRIIQQKYPYIGGAYKTGFENAKNNYLLMMSSDLETNPYMIPEILSAAEKDESLDIVCVSRWLMKSSFYKYNHALKFANFVFQKILRLIYSRNISDYTFAYRLYKTKILNNIDWKSYKHGFFLESLLVPLTRGAKVQELAGDWTLRSEGVRHISFFDYFSYIGVVMRNLRIREKQ